MKLATDLQYENVSADQRDLAQIAAKYFESARSDPLGGGDLGWFGIGIDPRYGGAGGETADLAVVIEAAGAALSASAVGEVALVTGPLFAGHSAPDVLCDLLEGRAAAAIPAASPWETAGKVRLAGGYVDGDFVTLGVERPDVLVVPLYDADGSQMLVLLPASDAAIACEPVPSSDVTRSVLRVTLDGAPVSGAVGQVSGTGAFTELMARRGACMALDAVGLARVALERTLAYAAVRAQFGRPIGAFQAYKHRCANAFIELKLAQSAAFNAAASAGTSRAALLGLAAGRFATSRATFICGEAVQLHGGIGFTWEAGLHAFLKRARMDEIIGRGCGIARSTLLALDDQVSDD